VVVRHYDAARDIKRAGGMLNAENLEQLRAELQHIHRAVQSGQPVDLVSWPPRGQPCRIKSGGWETSGVVIRGRTLRRTNVAATVLRQLAVIEFDAAVLEVID